jgi:hypothetical protein
MPVSPPEQHRNPLVGQEGLRESGLHDTGDIVGVVGAEDCAKAR